MPLLQKAKNALNHVRENGVMRTFRYARERAAESYHEWRLGIDTMGNFRPDELGIECPFSIDYYPADYATIFKSLRLLTIRPGHDGFLDLGCGMGRVVTVAGTFPFRSVLGVELAPKLADRARANLANANRKLRCGDARIVQADAATFLVPSHIHFVFFYSPFHGPVLTAALGNIHASLIQSPRALTVVFKNTIYLEPLLTNYPWLVKRHEFRASDADHKVMILEAKI